MLLGREGVGGDGGEGWRGRAEWVVLTHVVDRRGAAVQVLRAL